MSTSPQTLNTAGRDNGDMGISESSLAKSPALIFLLIALIVFVAEASVMLLLHYLPSESVAGEAVTDAALLVALISPALYFFLFRPMVGHIRKRREAEEALRRNEEQQFKLMIRTALDGFLIMDAYGRFLEVNDAYCRLVGYSRGELLGMSVLDVEAGEKMEEAMRYMREMMKAGSDRFEARHRRKDGCILDIEISANYDPAYSGRFYCFLRDITERKLAEKEIARSKEVIDSDRILFQTILDNAPIGLWLLGTDGKLQFINKTFCESVGIPEERFLSAQHYSDILPESISASCAKSDEECFAGDAPVYSMEQLPFVDGKDHLLEIIKVKLLDKDGRVKGLIGLATDITERKCMEIALQESEEKFRSISAHTYDALIMMDNDGNISFWNAAAEKTFGYPMKEVLGKELHAFIVPERYYEAFRKAFAHFRETGKGEMINKTQEIVALRKGGIEFPAELSMTSLRLKDKWHAVGIIRDITERKQAEAQMHYLAHYDALTGLPNRTLFSDRLRQSLAAAKRSKSHLALMFLDLDRFKPVNDTLGHDIGDLLLKEVAGRLQNCVRESDTVSRIGGDEFIVLLSVIETEWDAVIVAEKMLHVLGLSFEVAGYNIHISSSIGVSVYPEQGLDERTLIKNADVAMYHAKKEGRNNARLYRAGMVEE